MKLNLRKMLPIVSCVGTLATGALSAWGALKIKEHENSGRKKWLYAIPAVASAACTIAAIVFHNKNMTKELAMVSAGATYLAKKGKALETELHERGVSKEELKEIKQEMIKHEAKEFFHNGEAYSIAGVEETGTGKLLCIEGWNGRVFRASKEHVDAAVAKFKAMYEVDHSGVCFNDLYRLLRIVETHVGNRFGWPYGYEYHDIIKNLGGIGIYTTMVEDPINFPEPVYCIDFDPDTYPVECWDEL